MMNRRAYDFLADDRDEAVLAACPICRELVEWHGELAAERRGLLASRRIGEAIRMWARIDPVWRALRAAFWRAKKMAAAAVAA